MKLLYHGPLWAGGTALQRAEAFAEVPGVDVIPLDTTGGRREIRATLYERVRWKLGWPVDSLCENERLLEAARRERPDAIVVDNAKALRRETLAQIHDELGRVVLAYYTPDDAMARHNLKQPLLRSFDAWDLFFTTKTYNVAELRAAGVREPVLAGNSFDPAVHRPLSAAEAGDEFEAFDLVFVGALERARCTSLNRLAEAGMTVLVHGAKAGALASDWPTAPHPNITLRDPAYDADYCRAVHHGKIALGFLRKMNRDRITQRSIELPAMGRAMLAEKTDEHDAHFIDGEEYVGFVSDDDLIAKAQALLVDPARRQAIGAAGRARCLSSGYSTLDRARQMIDVIRSKAR
jgi:spore maturation protein CgeB